MKSKTNIFSIQNSLIQNNSTMPNFWYCQAQPELVLAGTDYKIKNYIDASKNMENKDDSDEKSSDSDDEQNILGDEYNEKDHPKIKQWIWNKKKGSNMELSFPESRLNRDHSKL